MRTLVIAATIAATVTGAQAECFSKNEIDSLAAYSTIDAYGYMSGKCAERFPMVAKHAKKAYGGYLASFHPELKRAEDDTRAALEREHPEMGEQMLKFYRDQFMVGIQPAADKYSLQECKNVVKSIEAFIETSFEVATRPWVNLVSSEMSKVVKCDSSEEW